MKVELEGMIGNAQIRIERCDHRANVAHQVKMALAMPANGIPEATAVAAFIKPLTGLGAPDLDRLIAALPATPLPTGYRHFRLFDALTGAEWHSSFVFEEGESHTLHDVVFGALNHPTLEVSAWKTTDWLPDALPGVLDLEIAIATRPRTSPMRFKL